MPAHISQLSLMGAVSASRPGSPLDNAPGKLRDSHEPHILGPIPPQATLAASARTATHSSVAGQLRQWGRAPGSKVLGAIRPDSLFMLGARRYLDTSKPPLKVDQGRRIVPSRRAERPASSNPSSPHPR